MTEMMNYLLIVLFSRLVFQVDGFDTTPAQYGNETQFMKGNERFFFLREFTARDCMAKVKTSSLAYPAIPSATPLFRLANGAVYYFSPATALATWYQARDFCVEHGMHLVTINTPRENALVIKQRHISIGAKNTWIGLYDSTAGSDWRWTYKQAVPTVLYFSASTAGQCGYINAAAITNVASWKTDDCTAGTGPFICEMELPCSGLVGATSV